VVTGLVLFMVDATSLAANPAFRLKLVLLVAAVANAAAFHCLVYRRLDVRGRGAGLDGTALPLSARVTGILSMVLWFAVIACGRLIAYV
jgi:hypothetical protein